MDMQIPLNRLKFGQDDGAGINARVVGRQDGIAELAVNLHAQGQIENLIVKDAGEGFYSVANGNRRLAAFHMLYGAESSEPISCTLHHVDETQAFEMSLTTAITARQLHPVDQYEAFARLDERGKSHDEIARQYGMTEKEVRQALALGRLSPKIRQAWRDGEVKAEVARAFTLALGHDTQDKTFDKLKADGRLYETFVKKEIGADAIDEDVAQLLTFIGADAYRARGGTVTEDLFGASHIISDENLLKQMTRELLDAKREELRGDGWAWAELEGNLPHGARYWSKSEPKQMSYRDNEKARLDAAHTRLQALEDDDSLSYNETEEEQERLEREIAELEMAVRGRSFDEKKKKQLGCIVDVEDGRLVILYGVKKPAGASVSPARVDRDDDDAPAAAGSKGAKSAAPEEPEISNALLQRLSVQLTQAAATALIQDEQLALSVLLAGFGCYDGGGVRVSVSGLGARGDRGLLGAEEMEKALPLATRLKPAERISLLAQIAANALDFQVSSMDSADRHDGPMSIINAIDAKAFNAAMRGAFDAKDYFAGVNKALNLKAIEEAMGKDMARQQSAKQKTEIVAFAIENVPKTGWLPVQLRAKGYDGPPVAKKATAAPTPKPAARKPVKPAAKKKAAGKPAKAVKRAAAAKKPASKKSKR